MASTIESVLQEDRVFPPSPEFVKQANISGEAAYKALCDEAERDFEGFWGRLANENVLWSKPFTKVLDESNAPFFKWFPDGELNASYNSLDRHLETQGDKVAIIFEADDGKVTKVTYKDLYASVCKLANALKSHGIQKGDRVLDLPADVDRGGGGDAGVRPDRRDAFGRVRRLLGEECAGADRRRRRGGGDHRRRPVSRRPRDPAQARGGRGARDGRLREGQETSSSTSAPAAR